MSSKTRVFRMWDDQWSIFWWDGGRGPGQGIGVTKKINKKERKKQCEIVSGGDKLDLFVWCFLIGWAQIKPSRNVQDNIWKHWSLPCWCCCPYIRGSVSPLIIQAIKVMLKNNSNTKKKKVSEPVCSALFVSPLTVLAAIKLNRVVA